MHHETPIRRLRVPEPFNDSDWIVEPRWTASPRSRMSIGITARLCRPTPTASTSWPQLAENHTSIKLVNLVITGH